jgi:hypothetical protein
MKQPAGKLHAPFFFSALEMHTDIAYSERWIPDISDPI